MSDILMFLAILGIVSALIGAVYAFKWGYYLGLDYRLNRLDKHDVTPEVGEWQRRINKKDL